MSNLITDLLENVSEDIFLEVNQKVKISTKDNSSLGKKVFGLLTEGMASNINKDKNESKKIVKTLEENHQGNLDLKNILSQKKDGKKILKHLFGEKENKILAGFAQEEKIETSQAKKLFALLAPIFMNSLATSKSKVNADSDVFGQLITMSGEVLGKKSNGSLINLLDKNKNGSIWDEVLNWIINYIKKNLNNK